MISTLNSLRGIFVVMIFLVHYPLDGPATFVAGGDCGVAFFMMLSGFVMTAGYEQRLLESRTSTLAFTGRRIAKFYPLHLLCLGVALLLYSYVCDGKLIAEIAANIMLLQCWIPGEPFKFNPVAWFLSDIVFLYLVFPFIIRRRLIHSSRAIAAFIAAAAAYVCLIPLIPAERLNFFCYTFPPARMIDFIWGMLLRTLYVRRRDGRAGAAFSHLSTAARTAVELCAVAMLVLTIALYRHTPECYRLAAMWWPAMAAVILVFGLSDIRPGLIGSLLKTKVLLVFGDANFVFFIIHIVGMSIIYRVIEKLGIILPDTLLLPVNLAGVTVAATVIHRYFQSLWNRKLHRANL